MNFPLKDIKPNPFRDFTRNPLNQEKVDELKASINDTGFWDNVLARLGSDGKPEIAYGHHRIEAARQAGMKEVGLIIRELSDANMLKIMARENSETYKYSVLALLESVRGAVCGLADGRIKPEEMPIGAKAREETLRYAPSFVPGVSTSNLDVHPYTALSVALLLGFTKKNRSGVMADKDVTSALRALHLMELKQLKEREIAALNMDQLDKVTRDREKSHEHRLAWEKRKAEEAAAAGKITDAQIKAAQKAEKEAKAKHEQEMKELDELVKKADAEEAKRLAAEAAERTRKAAEAAAEREVRRKEDEARRKKQKEAEEKALAAERKERRQAAAERAPKQEQPKTYFPHVTQIIKLLEKLFVEDQYYRLLTEVVRDRKLLTAEQKSAVLKARDKAVARLNAIKL